MFRQGHVIPGGRAIIRRLNWPALAVALGWSIAGGGGPGPVKAADPGSAAHPGPPAVESARPLHDRIDAVLAAGVGTLAPNLCSDEAYIRRASLDFRGFAPTADEVRAFAADSATGKRARLIDGFLVDPHHTRHLARVLDVVLMERRAEKHVKASDWRAWLRDQAAARISWDRLVPSLLAADGADGGPRGAARWLLDREAEPNALTRDAARLFLGTDLSCAQCHDHPRIADYAQQDFQGLLAFFSRTYLFQPDLMKPAVVGERAEGETAYVSVFTRISGQAKPCLPGGAPVAEPAVAPADQWLVAPNDKDKAVRPVPRQSRRALLAATLTHSRAFALHSANRFWAVLIGRGVIEPVELRHSGNPPAADALLDVLADGLVALKFDVSSYWREIALSRAYQAAYDLPAHPTADGLDPAALKSAAAEATLTEQETRRRETTVREAWEPLVLAAQAVESEAAAAAKSIADIRPTTVVAAAALERARTMMVAKSELLPALEAAAAQCAHAAAVVADAPELVHAAALLESRRSAAQTELEALTRDAAAKQADHATKVSALITAEKNAAALALRVTTARTSADAAGQSVAEAANAARVARDFARRATRDAERAAAIAGLAAAAHQKQEVDAQLADAENAAAAITTAAAGAQAVCAKLPDDQELAAVLVQVQSRQAAAMVELDSRRRAAEAATAAAATATDTAIPKWTEGFALSALTSLTPEQLCWSVLRTTGTLDQLHALSAREWDEKNPAPPDAPAAQDPARLAARATAINSLVEEKVRPHEDQFIRLFGNGPGSPQSEFFATSDQALYFENAGALRSWTQSGGGNLAERLTALADPAALASELYLAVLSRTPSAEESAEVVRVVADRPADQKGQAVSDTLWALLTSAEFRFKH